MNSFNLSIDIKFNFSLFLAFFIGFVTGIIFLFLIYVIVCLISLKTAKKKKKINDSILEEELILLIENKQKEFLILKKQEPTSLALKETIISLINGIAKKYYPTSKHPTAELTLEEIINLDRYIASKIEEILSRRGLRLLNRLKVATILDIMDTNAKIQNSKAIKASKKMHLGKIVKGINNTLHVLNPFHWFKRLVVSPSLNYLSKKIFLLVISIVGEETNYVYSKNLFLNENENIEEILKEIEQEDKKITNE